MSHKVIFGDSRWREDVKSNSIDLEVTAPPFFRVAYPESRKKLYGIEREPRWNCYLQMLEQVLRESCRCLKSGHRAVWIVKDLVEGNVLYPASDIIWRALNAGFTVEDIIYWIPRGEDTVIGKLSSVGNAAEELSLHYCYILKKGKRKIKPAFVNSGIWYYPRESYSSNDPQPVSETVVGLLIEFLSECFDKVIDPFLGTGTLIKVCEEVWRNGIGYEINPGYRKVIEKKIGKAANNTEWIE